MRYRIEVSVDAIDWYRMGCVSPYYESRSLAERDRLWLSTVRGTHRRVVADASPPGATQRNANEWTVIDVRGPESEDDDV